MQGFARQGASIVACCQFHDPLFKERARQLAAETGVGITPVVFDLASTDETLTAMGNWSLPAAGSIFCSTLRA